MFVDPALFATSSSGETPVQQPPIPGWLRGSNSVFLDLAPGLDDGNPDRSEIRVPVFAEVISGSSPLPAGSELVRIPPPPCPPGTRPAVETDLCGALVPLSWIDRLIDPARVEPAGLLRLERAYGRAAHLDPPRTDMPSGGDADGAGAASTLDATLRDAIIGAGPVAFGFTDPTALDLDGHALAAEHPPGTFGALRKPARGKARLDVVLVDAGFPRTRANEPERVKQVRIPAGFRRASTSSSHGDDVLGVFDKAIELMGLQDAVNVRCVDVEASLDGGPLWLLLGLADAVGVDSKGIWRTSDDALVVTAVAFRTPCSGESLFDRSVSRLASGACSILAAAGNDAVAWHQAFVRTHEFTLDAPTSRRIGLTPVPGDKPYAVELYVAEPDSAWRLQIETSNGRYEDFSLAPVSTSDRVRHRSLRGRDGDLVEVAFSGDGDDLLRLHLKLPLSLAGATVWLGFAVDPEWYQRTDVVVGDAPRIGIATRPENDNSGCVRIGALPSGRRSGPGSPAASTGVVAVGGYFQLAPHSIAHDATFAGPDDLFGRSRRFLFSAARNLPTSQGGTLGGSSASTMVVAAYMASLWASSPDSRVSDVEDALLSSTVASDRAGTYGVLIPGLVEPASVARPSVVRVGQNGDEVVIETDHPAAVILQFAETATRLRTRRFSGTSIGVPDATRRRHHCSVPDELREQRFSIFVQAPGAFVPLCIDGGGAGLTCTSSRPGSVPVGATGEIDE